MSAAIDLRPEQDEQRRVALVRVRGFAVACAAHAASTRKDLDAAIDVLVAARESADHALEECREACDLAERMAVFAARAMAGDVEPMTLVEAAAAIEELTR